MIRELPENLEHRYPEGKRIFPMVTRVRAIVK